VLTADCLPILLFDPVKRVIGAVHAGWRGTVRGVALKAIEAFQKRFGSRPADISAALGPYIGACCYRVKKELITEYSGALGSKVKNHHVYGEEDGHWFDIGRANGEQLAYAGVLRENITFDYACTCCDNEHLFSYRKEGPVTGRQMSFVMIKE
jgi:YfiH family protein